MARWIIFLLFFPVIHSHSLPVAPEKYYTAAEHFEKKEEIASAVLEYKRYLFYAGKNLSPVEKRILREKVVYLHYSAGNVSSARREAEKYGKRPMDGYPEAEIRKANYHYELMQMDFVPGAGSLPNAIRIREEYSDVLTPEDHEDLRFVTMVRLHRSGDNPWADRMTKSPFSRPEYESVRKTMEYPRIPGMPSGWRYLSGVIPGCYSVLYGNPSTGIKAFLTVNVLGLSSWYSFSSQWNVSGVILGFFALRYYYNSWLLAVHEHKSAREEYRNEYMDKLLNDHSLRDQYYRPPEWSFTLGKKGF